MSLCWRFWMLVRESMKPDTTAGSDGKAARSIMTRAGCSAILPRREMRRPFWSIYHQSLLILVWMNRASQTLVQDPLELKLRDQGFGGRFSIDLCDRARHFLSNGL